VLIGIQVVDLSAIVRDGVVEEPVCLARVGVAVLDENAVEVFAVVVGEQPVDVLDVVGAPMLEHDPQEVIVMIRHRDSLGHRPRCGASLALGARAGGC
jgi:hypothetical protein